MWSRKQTSIPFTASELKRRGDISRLRPVPCSIPYSGQYLGTLLKLAMADEPASVAPAVADGEIPHPALASEVKDLEKEEKQADADAASKEDEDPEDVDAVSEASIKVKASLFPKLY